MQVVGLTTQQEVYVASRERKFRINELLKIKDSNLGDLIGEVIETQSYNQYIPLSIDNNFVDQGVIESLESIGYDIADDEINIAKLRLLAEAAYPVSTGVEVVVPEFNQVRDLLVKAEPEKGAVLGVIQGTERLVDKMDDKLKGIAPLLKDDEISQQDGVPFIFKAYAMHQYPHIGIIGGSGSGKSFGMRVILEEMMELGLPTIVFDPHFEMDFNDSYPGLGDFASDYSEQFEIFQLGYDVGIKFSDLSTHDLINLLNAPGKLSDSMVNAVQKLHKTRDSLMTFDNRLSDLQKAQQKGRNKIEAALKSGDLAARKREEYRDLLDKLKEFGDLPASSVSGIAWRLGRLKREGIFKGSIDNIEAAIRSCKMTVVQGPIWLLQVFASYVLGNLYRKRRDYKDAEYRDEPADYFPPFIVATDEAHNFAPKGRDAPAGRVVKEIAQEGRKYGAFLVLATQRPTLLDETVTAQLNTKFVFRTVRASDIDTIKQETDLSSEEAKRLPYLPSGNAFVSSAIFGRTIPVRIRVAKTTSPHTKNPFEELKERQKAKDDDFKQIISKELPLSASDLFSVLEEVNQDLDSNLDRNQLQDRMEELVDRGVLVKEDSLLEGSIYKEKDTTSSRKFSENSD